MTPLPDDPYSAEIDADYQAIQQVYLDWHKGKRPLSGFVKDMKQIVRKARLETVEDAKNAWAENRFAIWREDTIAALQQPDDTTQEVM